MSKMSYQTPDVQLFDYNEIRDTIRSGDYLLCSGEGGISKAIRWFTGSDLSHEARLFWVKGCLLVKESVEGQGVRWIPLSNYVKDLGSSGKGYPGRLFLYRHKRLDTADTVRMERVFRWCVEKLGTKYDKLGLVKTGWILLKFKLGFSRKRKLDRDDIYFCSEFSYELDKVWDGDDPVLRGGHDPKGFVTPATRAMNPDVNAYAEIRSER